MTEMRLKMSQVARNKKLSPLKYKVRVEKAGAPSRILTYDLWIRSPLLYPAELWAPGKSIIAQFQENYFNSTLGLQQFRNSTLSPTKSLVIYFALDTYP